uniref:Uncharacterized protein n=1 Tax=Chelydra serpentina TaxID=8475 RepID=A0A8C3TDD8_CHESE
MEKSFRGKSQTTRELCSNPQFIVGGATRTDICQGALGKTEITCLIFSCGILTCCPSSTLLVFHVRFLNNLCLILSPVSIPLPFAISPCIVDDHVLSDLR